MEEQKKDAMQNENVGQEKTQKKPTYEELNNYCMQLLNQNKQLVERLQEMNATNLFKRLDYLFCVIQNKDTFDKEFLESCVKEIKEALTIVSETEEKKDTQNK